MQWDLAALKYASAYPLAKARTPHYVQLNLGDQTREMNICSLCGCLQHDVFVNAVLGHGAGGRPRFHGPAAAAGPSVPGPVSRGRPSACCAATSPRALWFLFL